MGIIWLHSLFMAEPPGEVSGVHRQLSPDECERERVAHGASVLTFAKEHIDGASKDLRDAKFDNDFSVEVFFRPLEAQRSNDAPGGLTQRYSNVDSCTAHLLENAKEQYRRHIMRSPPSSTRVSYEQWIVQYWSGTDFGSQVRKQGKEIELRV